MATQRKWYKHGDKLGKKLESLIARRFRRSRLLLNFDELNVLSFEKTSAALYRTVDKDARKTFDDIAEYVYAMALEDVNRIRGEPTEKKAVPKKIVQKVLKRYDPVTKYIWGNEIERKRARFFEKVISDKEADNRAGIPSDYTSSMNDFIRQERQYRVSVEDEASIQAYKDAGIKRVMWRAEHDDRVCEECTAMDGLIFPIDRIPNKPHYNCRCWLTPVI